MAKKNPQSIERRAMVEKMRQEQARKEKMRSFGILGFCVVIVIALLAAALIPYLKSEAEKDKIAATPIEDIGVEESAASCDPVKKESASGSGQHVTVGQPIEYKQAPPAYGEHWGNFLRGAEIRALYTTEDRPPVEQLVHSLEHGHTILWYDDTVKPGTEAYEAIELMADKLPVESYFMAAPWTEQDGGAFPEGKHVALTHWTGPEDQEGVWQYCGEPSGAVVKEFLKDYPASSAPEPGAP